MGKHKKLTQDQIDKIYIKSLKGYTTRDIAKEYKVSHVTIANVINNIVKDHNYQLSLATIATFLEQYHRYGDFLTNQVKELEDMKTNTPKMKLELMDAQFKRMVALIEKAGQGKLVLALRDLMKDESERDGTGNKELPGQKG